MPCLPLLPRLAGALLLAFAPVRAEPLGGSGGSFGDLPPFSILAGQSDRIDDVAHDVTTGTYVVVFSRKVPPTTILQPPTYRAFAQRVDAGGQLLGSLLYLGEQGLVAGRVRVANVNASDRFAVVWNAELSGDPSPSRVHLRTVDAATGALGTTITVAGGAAGSLHDADVGGQGSGAAAGRVLVVFRRSGTGIQVRPVIVPPTGQASGATTKTVVAQPFLSSLSAPAISRRTRYDRRYLIAYVATSLTSADIRAIAVDDDGETQGSVLVVSSTPNLDEGVPDVDGDGREFVVAWLASDPAGAAPPELRTARVEASSAGASLGVQRLVDSGPLGTTRLRVAHTESTTQLAFVRGAALRVASLVSETLVPAEAPLDVLPPGGVPASFTGVGLGSRSSGGELLDDRALLAWSQSGLLGQADFGQHLDPLGPGGSVVNFAGGCGAGGTTKVTGPVAVGSLGLEVGLAGASPIPTVALLNLTVAGTPPIVCGGCAWVPFRFLFVHAVNGGGASQPLPLPADPTLNGAVLEVQWTVFTPDADPCGLPSDFSLSNRVWMTIGT